MKKTNTLYELTKLSQDERTSYTEETLNIKDYPLIYKAIRLSESSIFNLDDMLDYIWELYSDKYSSKMNVNLDSDEEELYNEYERLYPELIESLLDLNFGSFKIENDEDFISYENDNVYDDLEQEEDY